MVFWRRLGSLGELALVTGPRELDHGVSTLRRECETDDLHPKNMPRDLKPKAVPGLCSVSGSDEHTGPL